MGCRGKQFGVDPLSWISDGVKEAEIEPCIRKELSGNLCRCTGYMGIVRALRRVLGERKARPQ